MAKSGGEQEDIRDAKIFANEKAVSAFSGWLRRG